MTKSAFVFVLFCLALVGCFFLVLSRHNESAVEEVTSRQTTILNTPSSTNSSSLLQFTPSPVYLTIGQTQTMQITLQTKDSPDFIQLELGYDPTILRDVAIEPGDFFDQSEVVLKTIRPTAGRISFAIKPVSQNKPNGTVVANLTFIPRVVPISKETRFVFLPKTILRSGQTDLSLKTEDVQLIFASQSAGVTTF